MSLAASERPKRSISSTIKEFIWGKPSRNQFTAFPERSEQEKPSQNDVPKNVEPIGLSEPREGFPEFVIVYEGNSQVRPPVLPILPVQRLRLLRQKQEWRKRHDLNLLYLSPSNVASSSPSKLNISNLSYKSSSTPSPTKMNHVVAPPLKRKKTSNNGGKGTKWSAEFEYDLAEYDTVERPGTPPVQNELPFDQVSAHKTVVGPLKTSLLDQDVNSNQLSSIQRKVLLNGPQSILPRRDSDKKENVEKPVKTGEKVILPSVGFDFIKSSDTPSKVKTQQRDEEDEEEEPKRKRKLTEPAQPSFKFGTGPAEKKDEEKQLTGFGAKKDEQSKPSFSFGEKKDEQPKPAFSFGAKKDEQPKPAFSFGAKKDEPPKPAFSFGEKKDEPAKPSFSFGTKKDELAKPSLSFGDKKDEPAKPSFSFGAKKDESAKPSFSFGAKKDENETSKPTLNFGAKKDDNEPAKPSFSFGAKKDDNEPTKPSFSFGAKDDEKSKPTASFGAGVTTAPSFDLGSKKDEPAEKPKPAFSFGTRPNEKPSFAFGAKDDDPAKKKPAFSFGAKQDESKQDDKADSKPPFSFGAGADGPSKPTFSFGAKKEGTVFDKPTPPLAQDASKQDGKSSGFSFNRLSQGAQPPSLGASAPVAAPSAPTFSFGSGANDKPPASNGPSVFAPTPQAAEKPFPFSRPNSNPSWPSQPGSAASAPGDNPPSMNFKFGSGSGSSMPAAAPPPASTNPLVSNPFVNKPSGFAFGSNSAAPFGASQAPSPSPGAPAPAFGNAASVSPAFGKSASPPVMPNFDPTKRAFTPSNSINLNFGGNAASTDPSRIFSGGSTNSQPMPGTASTPQQVFGGSQPPAPIFGNGPQPPVGAAGFNGAAPGMPSNPPQPPMSNFQLPPGRRLARMRQSRRA
ncbi:hypothetical protein ZYGR_0P00810 [Zygosaccharomyces rouxii]|uniref:Nucleoporin NUP1 n=1 Tax=Zygosaccharomyces rouxii TaxID=4956 RepID=A0A1Q3A159_ZYGRO|nr:hypothetical protein ZYGR_0P00810 [Zygosaccharomyces rouxii]